MNQDLSIINLILRFYEVTEGKITVDGQDLRDVTMSSDILGKTSNLDAQLGRVTAISFLGLDGAQERLKQLEAESRAGLQAAGLQELEILIDYIMSRLST